MRTAYRRHHDSRIVQRRLRLPKNGWIERDDRLSDAQRARWRGIICKTGTTCSRLCCRVNRRHYGPSIQERRQVAWLEVAP